MEGFNSGFSLMFLMFIIIFSLAFALIVAVLVKNLRTWNKNNNSPRLSVDAKVVAKRTQVSHHSGTDGFADSSSTSYFATFQVESGDRMELRMSGHDYGMLAEGDTGKLSFQGTRFLGVKNIPKAVLRLLSGLCFIFSYHYCAEN